MENDRPRSRLSGYLHINATSNDRGRTILNRRAYRSPIHISKPYWDGHALLLNVMSPTAGLLERDEVDINVSVEAGARLVLSNPTALRVHKMDTGTATWKQQFDVANNAFLESHPEWIILQAGSRFEQISRISLSKKSQLFFIEAIAPGRIASGESFVFNGFRNRLELYFDGRLTALDKCDIRPENQTHSGWCFDSQYFFYISIFVVGQELERHPEFFEFVHNLQTKSLLSGSSRFTNGPCWNIKLLAQDAINARAALAAIREQFYRSIGHPLVKLRR